MLTDECGKVFKKSEVEEVYKMNTKQMREFYLDKKDTPCPITEELIKSGFQQERGGYIAKAKEVGIEVDYKKAMPTQWWHLIKSYCDNTASDKEFPYSIKCGELYFWMAEVSGIFSQDELIELKDNAIGACKKLTRRNNNLPSLYTPKGNLIIRDYCYGRIKEFIENLEIND